ncbi:hypothetical protein ACMA46_14960 [Clavibacter sp. Sh2141]|uniref:hypothetical protein n=1 Tax=Clavibacter sp. Sh2141 TaxID=3395374 RepID=UPI0039BD933A
MTRRSDGDGEPLAVDPRYDPAFQRAAGSAAPHPDAPPVATAAVPDALPAEPAPRDPGESREDRGDRPLVARWLAPALWILAVAFPAAGLGLRALAAGIATSMPYSSFGEPLGQRWLLEVVPLIVTLAPGVVAGGPVAVVAALAVHALRRRPR